MKILVDMNLSPSWCQVLVEDGWDAVHWTSLGDPRASDAQIMAFARDNGRVVLTHDLDFSAMLALSRAAGPSVIQVRLQDVFSEQFRGALLGGLRQFERELEAGAIVVIDGVRTRARILPLRGAE